MKFLSLVHLTFVALTITSPAVAGPKLLQMGPQWVTGIQDFDRSVKRCSSYGRNWVMVRRQVHETQLITMSAHTKELVVYTCMDTTASDYVYTKYCPTKHGFISVSRNGLCIRPDKIRSYRVDEDLDCAESSGFVKTRATSCLRSSNVDDYCGMDTKMLKRGDESLVEMIARVGTQASMGCRNFIRLYEKNHSAPNDSEADGSISPGDTSDIIVTVDGRQ